MIDAFIELVNEEGVSRATTARIAERANVTWGVLQHQFGSKNAIVAAVMDAWTSDFLAAIDDIDTDHEDLEAVVNELVSVFWNSFSTPVYRAALKVLLNSGEELGGFTAATQRISKELYGCWQKCIKKADGTIDDETVVRTGDLMGAALSGYAVRRTIRSEEFPPGFEPQLAYLVKTLMAMLRGS